MYHCVLAAWEDESEWKRMRYLFCIFTFKAKHKLRAKYFVYNCDAIFVECVREWAFCLDIEKLWLKTWYHIVVVFFLSLFLLCISINFISIFIYLFHWSYKNEKKRRIVLCLHIYMSYILFDFVFFSLLYFFIFFLDKTNYFKIRVEMSYLITQN